MAWTPPATFVAGAVLTAAQLNTNLRDDLLVLSDPWTAFTPTWSGSTTNPVIGNGTLLGGYMVAGKWVRFWIHVTMGSTTTYGSGTYSLTLPVTENAHRWAFDGIARAAGSSYRMVGERLASGSVTCRVDPTTAGNQLRAVTNLVPATFTTGDEIFVSGSYEAA